MYLTMEIEEIKHLVSEDTSLLNNLEVSEAETDEDLNKLDETILPATLSRTIMVDFL